MTWVPTEIVVSPTLEAAHRDALGARGRIRGLFRLGRAAVLGVVLVAATATSWVAELLVDFGDARARWILASTAALWVSGQLAAASWATWRTWAPSVRADPRTDAVIALYEQIGGFNQWVRDHSVVWRQLGSDDGVEPAALAWRDLIARQARLEVDLDRRPLGSMPPSDGRSARAALDEIARGRLDETLLEDARREVEEVAWRR